MLEKKWAVISIALIVTICFLATRNSGANKNLQNRLDWQESKNARDKAANPSSRSQPGGAPQKADPRKQEAPPDRTRVKTADPKSLDETKRMLVVQVKQAIEGTISQAKGVQNPVMRIKIRCIAADGIWDYQESQAREILSEDFKSIPSTGVPRQDDGKPPTYKKRKLEEVKAWLRKELTAVISSHDPGLAESLLSAERNDKEKDGKDGEQRGTSELLEAAMDLSAASPEAASRIIRDSLRSGINPRLAVSLITLRQYAPTEASAIFNKALSMVRARGDLWDFQRLTPYVLPTEMDRLNGGSFLADPLRAKDAKAFIEYATAMLTVQLESPQPNANSSPELIMNEIYLWRSLNQLFSDLVPDKTWMVNTRLNQLSALRPESSKSSRGEALSPREILKKRISEAESATGTRRDGLFSVAAFTAMRLEDFDQAVALAERIESTEQREIDSSFILDKASRKALNQEGPDKALDLARKIKWPSTRVSMFDRIRGSLVSLGKREQAAALLEELSDWFHGYDDNSDKVWGILTYLDHFASDDPEKGFGMLGMLVIVLNKADLSPPVNPLPNRYYWYPEFHDFRKSLGALAKTDFERAQQTIQMLKDKEVFLLAQASLCNQYLKANQKRPSSTVSR